jgi:integrase
MILNPCLVRSFAGPEGDELTELRLGHPLLDDYLEFAGARLRRNSWLAVAYDLKVFFTVVGKEPAAVGTADVFAFIKEQRAPRRGSTVVRIEDGEAGLSARTIKRRLASVSGLYGYLVARGDAGVTANPVPHGSATRRPSPRAGAWGSPLIRTPRTLPRVLSPAEVDRFLAVLRSSRDRAMAEAMLLGGLRRCEVLGLRFADLHLGERRVFIAEGKGGHQRLVPISARFFASLKAYLDVERPAEVATDQLFVVLKGPRRGRPLSAAGLDEIVDGARARAGLPRLTCHQLRHTCLTRLREAGMALEAVQAQAGHRSIESTRIYLHLANGWLTEEYLAAALHLEASPSCTDDADGFDRPVDGGDRGAVTP